MRTGKRTTTHNAPSHTIAPYPVESRGAEGTGLADGENDLGRADREVSGRWQLAVPRRDEGPAELAWVPTPPLWQRMLRAVGVPTMVGVLAFALAVIVTVIFVVRGALAESGEVDLARASALSADTGKSEQPAPASEGQGKGGRGKEKAAAGLIVHVVGEVHTPGIVELQAGARVLDAIESAGGATAEAVLDAVNLARALIDGEQLVVPNAEAAEAMRQLAAAGGSGGGAGATNGDGSASGGSGGGGSLGGGQQVSLNSATAEQLQQLPGIGPALAERIISWRSQHGAFQSVDQLTEVSGIGAKTLAKFRDRLTL